MNFKTKIIIAVCVCVFVIGFGIFLRTTRQKFTISFDSNGAGEVVSQTVKAGNTVKEVSSPVRDDAVFLYWQLDGHRFDFSTKVDRNMELVAVWQLNDEGKPGEVYTVTFDSQGGSLVYEQEVEYGYTAKRPSMPIKNGYVFDMWTLDGERYDFSEEIKKDITLFATWLNTYTVTYTSQGKIIHTSSVTEGDVLTPPVDPTRYGYNFVKWTLNNKKYDFSSEVTSDLNLIASWEEKEKYTVTFVDYDKKYIDDKEVYDGEKIEYTKEPTREGFAFVCWTFNDEEYKLTKAVSSDIVLVAKYRELEEYEVVFDNDGKTTTEYVLEGSTVSKPEAPTKENYVFAGWLLDSKEYDFTTKINSDIKLVASWVEDKYTITITAEEDAEVKRVDVYKNGEKIIVTKITSSDGTDISYILDGTSLLVDEESISGINNFKVTLQSGKEIEIGI